MFLSVSYLLMFVFSYLYVLMLLGFNIFMCLCFRVFMFLRSYAYIFLCSYFLMFLCSYVFYAFGFSGDVTFRVICNSVPIPYITRRQTLTVPSPTKPTYQFNLHPKSSFPTPSHHHPRTPAHPLHTQHYTTSHHASSNTYNTTPSTAMSTSTPTTTHCSTTTFHKLVELNHKKTQHTVNSRYAKKTSQTTAHKPDSPSPCSPGSSYLKSLKRLGILVYGTT